MKEKTGRKEARKKKLYNNREEKSSFFYRKDKLPINPHFYEA